MSELRSPLDMTPEQLAQTLQNIKTIETWITAVKAHAFEFLKNGGKIPGYHLGYGVKKRIWKAGEEEKAIAALVALGVPRGELYTKPELLSLPKTEKLLKELGFWPKKRRNEQPPPTPLDPFTDYDMPEPRVLPWTGERDDHEGRVNDAVNDFN